MDSPDDEELMEKIHELKKKRNAFILAHNFQPMSVQGIADFVGGVEEILQEARKREEKVIVVAGVYFMAEMVAALTPDKLVLIPDPEASCPMVNMLDLDKLKEVKKARPGLKAVAYIKSSLEGIALSDYCWTYERALELLGESKDEVLFTPDIHVGQNLAYQSKRNISLLGGYCPPHVKILAGNVRELKEAHPKALVLAHPECRTDVVKLAHRVLSSEDMVCYVKASREEEFIVASEIGVVYRLAKENPDKKIYPASSKATCPNMKLPDPGKIYWSLKDLIHRVRVAEEISKKAKTILEETLAG